MNSVNFVGYLTKDIEVRNQGETAVASFSIGVRRGKEDGSDFINCTAWRHNAIFLGKYAKKGSQLSVSGRLRQRTPEDKDGNKYYTYEVWTDSVEVLGQYNKETVQEKEQVLEMPDLNELPI